MDRITKSFQDGMLKWDEMQDILNNLSKHMNIVAEKLALNLTDEYFDYLITEENSEQIEHYQEILETWIKNIFNSQLEMTDLCIKVIDGLKKNRKSEQNKVE